MDRRKFLIGMGSTSIGGSALVGTGAFSRIESQRDVTIQVAEDPNAYLGLNGCENSANSSYTELDEKGHLAVNMTPENPTDYGGQGINSDSHAWFDNVFQICNQGKQSVCVWIGDQDWPEVDDPDGEYSDYHGDQRIDFYVGNDRDRSLIGASNGVVLGVGACICVGIHTLSKGLSEGDKLLGELDNEIVIHADEGAACPDTELPPEEEPPDDRDTDDLTAISFIAFCPQVAVTDIRITHENGDGEPVGVRWQTNSPVDEVVLMGGQEWYLYRYEDGVTSGAVLMDSDEATDWKNFRKKEAHGDESPPFRFDSDETEEFQRCESSPCLGVSGTKIEYEDDQFDTLTPVYTQDKCPPRG